MSKPTPKTTKETQAEGTARYRVLINGTRAKGFTFRRGADLPLTASEANALGKAVTLISTN